MSSTGNLPVTVQDSPGNIGRQSPQTVVRDVDDTPETVVRERNIPIRLTNQPAPQPAPLPLSSRFPSSLTATPAEKVPFLQPEKIRNPEVYLDERPERLTLIKSDMADNGLIRSPDPSWQSKLARATRINNVYVRDFLAEFLGSFILIVCEYDFSKYFLVIDRKFSRSRSSATVQ